MYVIVSGNPQRQNNTATAAAEAPHADSKTTVRCFSQTEQKLFNVQTAAVPAPGGV